MAVYTLAVYACNC